MNTHTRQYEAIRCVRRGGWVNCPGGLQGASDEALQVVRWTKTPSFRRQYYFLAAGLPPCAMNSGEQK